MKTRNLLCVLLIVTGMVAYGTPSFAASDCPNTSWEPRNGRSCKTMGLDSNQAVCRQGDAFAMRCDDTKDRVRICASNQRCGDIATGNDAGSCPRHIRKESKHVRKCSAYEEGYRYGARDARDNRRDDYERWDDKFNREMEDYFEQGYRYGYRDNE